MPKQNAKARVKKGRTWVPSESQDLFTEPLISPVGLPPTPGQNLPPHMILSPSKTTVFYPQEESEDVIPDTFQQQETQQEEDASQFLQSQEELLRQEEVEEHQQLHQPEEEQGTTHSGTDSTDGQTGSKLHLSKREEASLVEWLQENDFLYNRLHEDHKNKDKKQRVLEEKGRSLRPPRTLEEMNRWIHSRRTQYGRLSRKLDKSGSGRRPCTDHEAWILKTFGFFQRHIQRQRPTKSLGIP